MDLIVSFLMGVGSFIFFRYFLVAVPALMFRVFSSAFMFRSFSSMPGNSAKTIRWCSSSKRSTSGSLSSIRLGIGGNSEACIRGVLNLQDSLATWKALTSSVLPAVRVWGM